ncbi:sugar phosphate isomerase/epimerase family protein [Arthrobacter sp. A2-55]|uniref:sugar phosphate isomerase/epimerase family protein n=1 Tax=Arthrobacter sp. A2-55 TaxID=2897337 RepID=UPI0021CD8D3D|nr:sugar phosphate isomerase/epimerase [Arthrobacter sp. A2-55]MCU6482013.1 sugar phosphate isomerase/epimerase [Arthrobacter sp. A2-55]
MTVFNTGLMSVTFRKLSLAEIVQLAADAGLGKISWSGDVHVVPGDDSQADRARELCAEAGIGIEGYGSYWRADGTSIDSIAATASRLGAPRIRVWAGSTGSAETSDAERIRIALCIASAADHAAARGIALHLEFHRNTLTDTAESTLALLSDIAAAREVEGQPVRSYWQPRPGIPDAPALAELELLKGQVDALHVFSWQADGSRLPLGELSAAWRGRLDALSHGGAQEIDLMLEFVAEDSPQQMLLDARELHSWLAGDPGLHKSKDAIHG